MLIYNNFLRLLIGKKKKDPINNPPKLRKDFKNIKIQENVYFQVYWKVLEIGKGPAVILFIFGEEILKFDCFGKDKGHYHINSENSSFSEKIFFEEISASDQIERTISELRNNLNLILKQNKRKKVRELEIVQEKYDHAIVEVKFNMLNFLNTKPELSDI